MWFGVISLFPEMFDAVRNYGVVGRAIEREQISLQCWNPRDFATDRHRTVDDRPYGGGPGMLMKVQPLADALAAAKAQAQLLDGQKAKVIYLSPQGRKLDHDLTTELSRQDKLICIAGRYEGVDERLIEAEVDEEISLGDFVLSGGELAAMALIDSVSRQVPGVLGHSESAVEDSFVGGLLDCPHYTRPEDIDGRKVPDVLLAGHHEEIRKWRLKQSLGRTWLRRPDLFSQLTLDSEQRELLDEFINEANGR
jgi:tRNA (guanine37-N1)-methyltransferase